MTSRPQRRTNLAQAGHAVHVKSSRQGQTVNGARQRSESCSEAPANHEVKESSSEMLKVLLTELLRLQTTRNESQPSTPTMLQPSKPAPYFEGTAVVDGEFKTIKLDDYKGKYLVLFFYPLDFTFVCPTEIIAFSDRANEFHKVNCEVVGCSTDSHFSHLAWINTSRKTGGLGEMKIPLLADKSCHIARTYGVLKEEDGVAFRGLFIIDTNGILRQITVNDMPVGRSVDEVLRLVQAFQFTDKHGEVCPAGWKPGAKTMKPGVNESKEYFRAQN